ncbi:MULTISPECIES: hypothetical protein [unclassified Parafrankia]|uniref:hypothetical protein n=1 Tax=unclassified Parafrankia TaxID=2994368 RepID=UPI000DA43BFC|nr:MULTISPECIES: hypothetical protein [unclassified Parafrankia]TCJ34075.1 hypothetical protein E0504_34805 [Parafrankia sp. BMG5.11]SQE00613.1 conserved hypothetical protein [Parafrankia sp. Ea1.12]
MPIFPSGHSGAWRTPGEDSPLVGTRVLDTGEHELTIRPGADIGDLLAILATLPPDAFFTEHFGDVDVALVFHQVPGDPVAVPAGQEPSAGPTAARAIRP